jgi:co-chaperonin GroES (HSP10)
MTNIKTMNEYLLVKLLEEDKTQIFLGENKNSPKKATIIAFSDECKNKNFELGKTVVLNRYDMIPYNEEEKEFFVSEKAVLGMF